MKDKSKRSYMQYVISLVFIFVVLLGLGVIAHRIFSIESALSGYLGFNDMPRRNHLGKTDRDDPMVGSDGQVGPDGDVGPDGRVGQGDRVGPIGP